MYQPASATQQCRSNSSGIWRFAELRKDLLNQSHTEPSKLSQNRLTIYFCFLFNNQRCFSEKCDADDLVQGGVRDLVQGAEEGGRDINKVVGNSLVGKLPSL